MRKLSFVGLMAGLLVTACGAPGVGTPTAGPTSGGSVTFMDTAGGANIQSFFGQILPDAEKELGIKVQYLPGSGPDLQTRLSAQKDGQADVGLVLLKPDVLGNMVSGGITFASLTDQKATIPNLGLIEPKDLQEAFGVTTGGRATPFWRDQFGIIYDSAKISKPPTSWQDFISRKNEWKGHIGMIRPDAGSGGGRLMMRDFLIGQGVDFSMPFAQLQTTQAWKDGLAKFKDFTSAFYLPLAADAPGLFNQFKQGDTWITEYAIDFTLWSADQGLLQNTVKATIFPSGLYGGASYLAVPANAPADKKAVAYRLVNWLISQKTQVRMQTQMYEYMAINKFDAVPAKTWDKIPRWSEVQSKRIPLSNLESFNWIKQNGTTYVAKS